ncbi:hypothetical protein VP01_2194g1 [Puccinia sorghi]|uniref:Uncharacterized protein n=1 Tax=Puccinia sorghi TaxID=27349 RepID=A0A0L6V948_9BASI|nr:hypothetical protein VP01_2194g1 [Puccinia sorghi]
MDDEEKRKGSLAELTCPTETNKFVLTPGKSPTQTHRGLVIDKLLPVIILVHNGTFNTILNPHVIKFCHFFSSAQIGLKQLKLMTQVLYENFMFQGVKSCVKCPNVCSSQNKSHILPVSARGFFGRGPHFLLKNPHGNELVATFLKSTGQFSFLNFLISFSIFFVSFSSLSQLFPSYWLLIVPHIVCFLSTSLWLRWLIACTPGDHLWHLPGMSLRRGVSIGLVVGVLNCSGSNWCDTSLNIIMSSSVRLTNGRYITTQHKNIKKKHNNRTIKIFNYNIKKEMKNISIRKYLAQKEKQKKLGALQKSYLEFSKRKNRSVTEPISTTSNQAEEKFLCSLGPFLLVYHLYLPLLNYLLFPFVKLPKNALIQLNHPVKYLNECFPQVFVSYFDPRNNIPLATNATNKYGLIIFIIEKKRQK